MRYLSRTIIPAAFSAMLSLFLGCGGNTLPAHPTPAADFTLSATPSSLTLAAGTKQTFSVQASAVNGFSSEVSVALSGLPTGVSASPASLTLTPGTAQSVTLTAAPSAAAATSAITLTGVSGTLRHTASVQLDLTSVSAPTPDFSLSASPASLSLTAGESGQSFSISALAANGFTDAVAVTLSGLPSGVAASPATLNLTPGAPQTITLTADSSAVTGVSTIILTGQSGALTHTAALALTVTAAAPPPDFSLTLTPASLTLTAGDSGQAISVSASAINNFTGSVALTLNGLPSGITANPTSLTLTPGAAQNITFTASSTAAAGLSAITLTGRSGSLTHTATLALTVTAAAPPPDFSLTLNPASLTLTAGDSGRSISVSASAINNFTGSVALTLTGLPSGVTASPATLNLTPGAAQNITFTASSTAAAGLSTLTLIGKSGALTHTAALDLTVTAAAPSPDFSLTLSPASLSLTAGDSGQSISISARASNGFTDAVALTLTGLPSGVTASPATLNLTSGAAQNITLTASSTAAAGVSTVTLTGKSGALTHTATLALTVQAASTPPTTAPDVTTYHYDNARDGLNAQETVLTPSNVNSSQFGKLALLNVDGHVDAQPLFLANLAVNGHSRNVLYVATEHGSLYAFDADAFTQLWKVSLIPSGETPSDAHNCNQIIPEIGITATPVIDRAHGALFAIATSKDSNGAYHQRLYAIDIATGAQLHSATEITASYPGSGSNSQNGNVTFDPASYAERAGLLLLNGNIYTAWTSHCDEYPYSGWIIAYNATTLQQSQVLNITPNGGLGAIWMAGDGLAADSAGSIYLLDGNGTFDTALTNGFPAQADYGNAILRLSSQPSLQVADYFESYNTLSESNADLDLGSGGLILLPDLKDANGATRQLLVGAGKDGAIYLADRANLGKYNPSTSAVNSNLYQYLSNALGAASFSTPAYFNGALYYGPIGRPLLAFPITQARLAASPQSSSAATFAYPGTTPAISANGSSNGIVWALESNTGGPAVLHAYDPTNLAHEYYNSNQASGGRDSFGDGNKYIAPVIVNGKVYIGTPSAVAVFGLLNP